jgi:phospholipase/carboxylesterase
MPAIALDGLRRGPASGRQAKQLVVLIHGLGSDGADISALATYFAKALPDAAFVAPDAPMPQDGAPTGRQWFEIGDIPVARLHAGIEAAAAALDGFVTAERERLNLLPRNVALVGFSQGAMLAMWSALRRDPGPGAVLAYAGALVGDTRLEAECRWRPPVLLVHGTDDTVIPPGYSQSAERVLRDIGVPVRALFRRGLGHTLDSECIAAGAAFLADWAEGKLVAAAPRPAAVT